MKYFINTLLSLGVLACTTLSSHASEYTAYKVPTGTIGDQDLSFFPQNLGMDFDVNSPVFVNSLGVFDSAQNGIRSSMSALIFDRDTKLAVASLIFTSSDPGSLVGGSRFKSLENPLLLPQGFKGTIVASYSNGSAEPNGNRGNGNGGWSTDTGNGLITFVGGGRISYGSDPTVYPTVLDGGPADRYAAGTFTFSPVPEPGLIPLLSMGLLGCVFFRRNA